MYKILYLAAGHGKIDIPNVQVVYQDLIVPRDLGGDMLEIDLDGYDLIIATPPCNYYSRANYRRNESEYSLKTRHLLPNIIYKLQRLDVPVIVENVRNKRLMNWFIQSTSLFYHEFGRHSYFTNRLVDFSNIPQIIDNIQYKKNVSRQGGFNVQLVLEHYIKSVL